MSNKLGIKIEDIMQLYNDGKTPIQIAEIFGCHISNITKRLRKYGVNTSRDYTKSRYNRTNRHKVNLSFFECIDNEEKAYFLGLMMSDGSVHKNGFYLKMKDEDIIVKFKEVLCYDGPVKHDEIPYYSYKIQVYSQKMVKDLINLGCTPNKTHTLVFPTLPDSLVRHFIRGYMDGDGCIRVGKNEGANYFDITSASYGFLLSLKPIIESHVNYIGISKEKKYDVWHLRCGGKQVKQLLDWLYQDSTVYLQRKFFKYKLLSPQ